ncbi:hypothetical protein BH09VER1_BH09VER1_42190 [soil metagenome]
MKVLANLVPFVLPLATRWAEREEQRILQHGVPLSESSLSDARSMGVSYPNRIRLLKVDCVPAPQNPLLRWAGRQTGLISPATAGMALRYGIFIRSDCWNNRHIIAHECAHTAQYERLGSLSAFLAQYLRECLLVGYPAAPLEQEAIERCAAIPL